MMRVLIEKIKDLTGSVYFQTPVNAINEETDKHVEIAQKMDNKSLTIQSFVVVCGAIKPTAT